LGVLALCSLAACAGGEVTQPPPRTATASSVAALAAAPAPESSPNDTTDSDDTVVAGMQQGFRECYQIGLWNNPHQSGSVRLVVKLDPHGRPSTVTPHGGAGLDRMVIECLSRVARRGTFAPPTGDGTVVVPLKFRSDRALEAAQPAALTSGKRN
jgi:hypothetical protein